MRPFSSSPANVVSLLTEQATAVSPATERSIMTEPCVIW